MIRAPHCVNTRDFQVPHSYKLLMPSKTCYPIVEPLHANMNSSINIKHRARMATSFFSKGPQARFHERFFASHVSEIGGNTVIPSSLSLDQTVHGFQHANILVMLQLQLSRQLGDRFAERAGNWLRLIIVEIYIVVVVHMLFVQVALKKCTLHVFFVSLKSKRRNKCQTYLTRSNMISFFFQVASQQILAPSAAP